MSVFFSAVCASSDVQEVAVQQSIRGQAADQTARTTAAICEIGRAKVIAKTGLNGVMGGPHQNLRLYGCPVPLVRFPGGIGESLCSPSLHLGIESTSNSIFGQILLHVQAVAAARLSDLIWTTSLEKRGDVLT